MKKGLSKANLQSPFSDAELKSVSRFIDYCKDNGVRTSIEELEQLHKEGLLYPAIKVYYGVIHFKKILIDLNGSEEWKYVNFNNEKKFKIKKTEKQTYYGSGGFLIREGWLDYYKNKKMVEYPSQEKFRVWKRSWRHPEFVSDYSLIEKEYEFFYDKIQLLSLKYIQKKHAFWMKLEGKQKRDFTKLIKKRLQEINKFANIYFEIENVVLRAYDIKNKKLEDFNKEFKDQKEVYHEWKSALEATYLQTFKRAARDVLIVHSFKEEDIKNWIMFLQQQNIFQESNRDSKCIRTYLRHISEKDLVDAENTNYMIFVLNQFLFFVTGEFKTVKQTLMDSFLPLCVVCGKMFKPRNKDQKTCADPNCVNENKNKSKRKK
jgi:hypothetical protein